MSLTSIFQDIADAIRSKTGKSESIYPVDMASEIEGISSGGGYKLEKMPSGAVSSFNDGTDLPLNKLKVSIEPVQDLHGYDAPWVGGAGKNKYPDTQDVNLGGTNPRSVNNAISVPIGAGTYVISWKTTGEARPYLQMRIDGVHTSLYSGSSFTVTSSANQCYWYITTADYDANKTAHIYDIQIESGSTSTTFAPYSNICPISGWDEVNVEASWENLFDKTKATTRKYLTSTGEIKDNASWRITDFIEVEQSIIYKGISTSGIDPYSCWYDENKNFIGSFKQQTGVNAINVPSNAQYVRFSVYELDIKNFSVTEGSITTIPFHDNSDNPLTVYGGTLDVTSGELTVTDAYIASYNAETLPSTWISDRDVYAEGTAPTTGAEVVYKLANSVTYHLTPVQIRTLVGNNNIWADTGDIINGEYFKGADTRPTS